MFGMYHSKLNRYNFGIACKNNDCSWKLANKGDTTTFNFPKSDFLEAELIRIDKNGDYIDTSKMKMTEQSKLGHSIRLKLRMPVEEGSNMKIEKYYVFMPYDMGRRTSRSGVKSMMAFVLDKTKDSFYYDQGKNVTLIGVLSCFFGVISLLLVMMFGKWRETVPQRLKKSS
jgi:hypothetical protein